MTTVYGVTFIGARAQIEKQLKDRKDIPGEECWAAASYVAKLVCRSVIYEITTYQTSYRLSRALVIYLVAQTASRRGSISAPASSPNQFQVTGLQRPWKSKSDAPGVDYP
jgi:DNA-directed RNA polymerase